MATQPTFSKGMTDEEMAIHQEIAEHLDLTMDQYRTEALRAYSKGILDNPEYLGAERSDKLKARLKA